MSEYSIQILGSAAAEGIPALFCTCPLCQYAWEHRGKDIRKRTAYKINERVRVDFGPDSMMQEHQYALHSENLRHLFITHSHFDHLAAAEFLWRRKGFSAIAPDSVLNVYGGSGVIRELQENSRADLGNLQLNPVRLNPFEPLELPEENQIWYPMPADHMYENIQGEPFIYAVRDRGKQFLIANDTGYFSEEVWEYIAKQHFVFDLVISDCTGCLKDIEHGHMSGKFVLQVRERLLEMGAITGDTRYFINHFSHNGRATHAQLESHFNPLGIEVGYDGLVIEY